MTLNEKEFTSELTRIFAANSLSSLLNIEASQRFYALTQHMLEENEKYNLTAITEPERIILNHYADCASLVLELPKRAKIIDVGCGAGFPSLPIAILRGDVTVAALDSTAKRTSYVEGAARLLGLDNLKTLTMRAEDAGKSPELRERFDIATARAVAELRVLSELCLPLVKVGGRMIAMKGKNAEFELSGAKRAIATLGGKNPTVKTVNLTDGKESVTHPLIFIEKAAKTSDKYPRPFAQISKKPL